MQFFVVENGRRVGYQAVNRNGKIYYRRSPITLTYPTKAQIQVRYWLSLGSHEAALKNANRKEVLESVRDMPYHINPFRIRKFTTTDLVKEKYPEIIGYTEVMENGKTENIYSRRQEGSIERVDGKGRGEDIREGERKILRNRNLLR